MKSRILNEPMASKVYTEGLVSGFLFGCIYALICASVALTAFKLIS